MSKFKLITRMLLLGAGLALVSPASHAAPRKKAKKEQSTEHPAVLKVAPRLKPRGLKFGASLRSVTKTYDRAIEEDFRPRLKEAEPGIQMERVKYEMEQRKQQFRLSLIDFDGKPNSLDATPFSGEFANGNSESMMRIKRRGRHRHLFLFKKKLWKTIDVYDLKDGGKWGPTFKGAITKIQKVLKVEGRALEADADAGRKYEEVDWADGKTHLRVINWGKKLAIAYVDKRMAAKLKTIRKNKDKKASELDPSVKKVLR